MSSDRDFNPPFNRGVPKLVHPHSGREETHGAAAHLGEQFGGAGQRTGYRAGGSQRKRVEADQAALIAYTPPKGQGRKTAFQAAMWAQALESTSSAKRRRNGG